MTPADLSNSPGGTPQPAVDRGDLIWRCGNWRDLAGAAGAVRRAVFVDGMDVPEELDFDGTDDDAQHLVVFSGGRAIGTGRLHLPEARIGRMAVLPDFRGSGIGSRILQQLLSEAIRRGFRKVTLHAQQHAIPFYRRFGFREEGQLFEEAGIPHQTMRRGLEWTEASAAVIIRAGKLLLGLRAPQIVMGGHWDLFGGRVEAGESAEEALERELREELAIDARIGQQLEICLYRDPAGGTVFRSPVFLVTSWSGEIALNEEHTEFGWFRPHELGGLELAHPAIPKLLEMALTDSSEIT